MLKFAGKLGSLFLVLWLFVSPSMACLLPVAQLTQQEKACCKHMAGMCDEMGKDMSHSCCVKVKPHNSSQVILSAGSASLCHSSAPALIPITNQGVAVAVAVLNGMPNADGYPPGYSPPVLPELIAFRI